MVERVNSLARQLSVGEALTVDVGHSGYEAICVTDALFGFFAATIVVTEYLFTEVTLKDGTAQQIRRCRAGCA